MSDTYFIKNLQCAHCGENNDFEEEAVKSGHIDLPYTSEFGGEFVCDRCKKKNEVVMDFVAVTSQPQGNLNKIMKKDFNRTEIRTTAFADGDCRGDVCNNGRRTTVYLHTRN